MASCYRYSQNGDKTIKITASNTIKDGTQTLEAIQKVSGQLGDIKIDVIPYPTVTGELQISTEQQFEIIVSTESLLPANFSVDFGDGSAFKKDEGKSVKFVHKYSQPKVYSVNVNVTVERGVGRGNTTVSNK